MPRSQDLDQIAPDDLSTNSTVPVSPIIKTESTPIIPPAPIAPSDPDISVNKPEQGEVINSPQFKQKIYNILGHTKSPLSSFLVRPDVFSFQERDIDEEIILVLRPHWFTNLSWILISIIMLFVPLLLPYVPILNGFPAKYQSVAVMFWYLITFAYAFEKFLSWYFDVSIITSRRVVDIDFNNLLDKKFSDAQIAVIQDVTSRVSGVSQTIFNYGTVLVQTASEINELIFEKVPRPDKVVKILSELRQQYHDEHDHR